jgi:nitrile hydratase accessory protein
MNSQDKHVSPDSDGPDFADELCKPIFRAQGEAPFNDSWEAEAYAMGNLLVKLNHLTSKEWMSLMAESIKEAQNHGDPDTGETYYHHWCRSIEKFCFRTGISDPDQHKEILDLWKKAVINTPHGVPLVLENAFLEDHSQDDLPHSIEHPDKYNSFPSHTIEHHHSHERPDPPQRPITSQSPNRS